MSRHGQTQYPDYRTPRALFDPLHAEVGFKVDAAASAENKLLPIWYGPGSMWGEDALSIPIWHDHVWCNPPGYGGVKELKRWLAKFREQVEKGISIIALLPAKTDTKWFHEMVVPFADLIFLTPRVPFERDGLEVSRPNHGSVLTFWTPEADGEVGFMKWKKEGK